MTIGPKDAARLREMGISLHPTTAITLNPRCSFEPPLYIQSVKSGSAVQAGAFTSSAARLGSVSVGRYCAIGPDVVFGANEHPTDWLSVSRITHVRGLHGWAKFLDPENHEAAEGKVQRFRGALADTKIGNDVWIGQGAFIKSGITIGSGAVVAARSVVTKDVHPYSIVAGTPARHIRHRFPPSLIERLLTLQWWKYNLYDFQGITYSNVEESLDLIADQIGNGSVKEYTPTAVTPDLIATRLAASPQQKRT
ncbi:CatB-related O-acetyltransferase [Terrihabitans sp. B22-R8]|uniref:CatB-related O-acetyltransferase n=1 Tax=Terrihabitans sp. B22-R8 TaxID=3425128 RepID=UPI00403D3247